MGLGFRGSGLRVEGFRGLGFGVPGSWPSSALLLSVFLFKGSTRATAVSMKDLMYCHSSSSIKES